MSSERFRPCAYCGAVGSPEPEFQGICPDCVRISIDLLGDNHPLIVLMEETLGVIEKPTLTHHQELDIALDKVMTGIPEVFAKIRGNPLMIGTVGFNKGGLSGKSSD